MKISAVIPGYNNSEAWWRRCVESVIRAGADEIICVDDGSRVRPKFLETYPVRVVYREVNGGLATARNDALQFATGDYVTFIDSDDEIRPETFAACRGRLEETEADVAVYGVELVWPEDGLKKIDVPNEPIDGRRLEVEDIKRLYDDCLLNYSCNKVYRKSFLEMHGLRFPTEGMPCEDIIFNLNVIRAGARYCTVEYVGYVYYRTRGTLLSRYKKTSDAGTRLASETWRRLKEELPRAHEVLGALGEVSEAGLREAAWRNCWMPGTPYSLVARWKQRPGKPFFRMLVFSLVRRHFYFRFVRRWNTKRVFKNVREIDG